MGNRRAIIAISALALLAVTVRHPSANIQIIAHQASDVDPHRFQAAIDLGVMAFSILITWTGKRLSAGN